MTKNSLKKLQQKRQIPQMHGPATARQQLLAAAVDRRVAELRPTLGARAQAAEMRTRLPDFEVPEDVARQVDLINDRYRQMSDEQMGQSVRMAYSVMKKYLDTHEDSVTAALLEHAVRTFSGAVAALSVGGTSAARKALGDAHTEFEEMLLLCLNGELTVIRASAEAWVKDQGQEMIQLAVDAARSVRDEQEALEAERAALQAEIAEARQLAEVRLLDKQDYARLVEQQAAEIESLRQQLADVRSAADAQELHTFMAPPQATMPSQEDIPMPEITFDTPLQALSFRAYLKAQGLDATVQGRTVICAAATSAHRDGWQAAHPTPESQREQLAALLSRRGVAA